jgi:hypothetical protein
MFTVKAFKKFSHLHEAPGFRTNAKKRMQSYKEHKTVGLFKVEKLSVAFSQKRH